jgi:phosphohistidine phosphatase
MPALHLLRHAKSVRSDDVEDRERPLSRRGREQARLVGSRLLASVGRLDLVLCSSALRTRETMELMLSGYTPPPRILIEDALYLASAAALVGRLRRLSEVDDNVLLIGHNPGLHELALALAAPGSAGYRALAESKFPTAARASLHIGTAWSEIDRSRHPVVDYATPKSLGGKDD